MVTDPKPPSLDWACRAIREATPEAPLVMSRGFMEQIQRTCPPGMYRGLVVAPVDRQEREP